MAEAVNKDTEKDPHDELRGLELLRLGAYKVFAEDLASARRSLDDAVAKIDARAQELMRATGDLKVLVRWKQGPMVTVYHSATHPCGRVTGRKRDRGSFTEKREATARASGLSRCSACRWLWAERQGRGG